MQQVQPVSVPSDIEIARAARLLPIDQVARRLCIGADEIEHYGKFKAKLPLDLLPRLKDRPQGRLVLVTAISPTPAGEGKTTTSVGLADALSRAGKKTVLCLREPSLGPCFGMKGGAAGGGYSQVVPMEDINLHFTGDFHAITAAHNLLAAAIDNHLHRGNALQLDPARITWRRVLDVNDRSLRDIEIGLGDGNGPTRRTGFDITAASEVMAILTLATSLDDLRARLGRIVVGESTGGAPVTAADLHLHGAMTVLLKDALAPNLVQTLEGNPALVHGGPFGNIAHGCNSVMATSMALRLGDFVVTEAGFGADLGAEKFFDIKCRAAGLRPAAAVLVATLRALKFQGGVSAKDAARPDAEALRRAMPHLLKHVENLGRFGVPVVVCVNEFSSDTEDELALVQESVASLGATVVRSDHWARGGAGAEALAAAVIAAVESGRADFRPLYPDDISLIDKVEIICREIYGADGIEVDDALRRRFEQLDTRYRGLPVCMAKTQYSFSTDPKRVGRPQGFTVPLRDVVVRAGAGFVLVLTGSIMTMPGLPKVPAAESIDLDAEGRITGLS